MDTSYKDTIDVSWTVATPDHLPILQIECWFRNKSISLGHAPDLATNILDLTELNMTNVQVVLEPFKIFSPCHFSITDGQNHSLTDKNAGLGGDFAISDTNNAKGQVWSLNNPALLLNATATAGSGGMHASFEEAIVWLSWVTVPSVVLLAY